MLLMLGAIIVVSGALTWYILKSKDKQPTLPPDTYAAKEFDYKGVRKHDFIRDRVMFYPYNYVNG